jgi:UDP-N-acetylglucosamine--N-acetylmuramyl-(pentapeptide) pyrophosphoryl-undecaprenol N-acetylglucosamine transferase
MKLVFAGGGTGGHINPALSVADYVAKHQPGSEMLFVGTKRGLETKLVPAAGYNIEYIDICGFDRRNMFKNISVVKKLIKADADCVKLLKEFKPDAVVCTGGYVSGPVATAASKCGIPALIHEQNVYPGLTVKGTQKFVDYVAVSFDETRAYLKQKDKCVVTGNPVRSEILTADREANRKKLGLDEDDVFVLIFGGSLGAEKINEAVLGMIKKPIDSRIKILFGTGERSWESVCRAAGQVPENVTITPYIHNMAEVMSAADLVAARSGAITVSELACMAKPAVLIPSPNVVRNHQEQNAREFAAAGAAVMLKEDVLSPETLYDTVTGLAFDKKALSEMSEQMKRFARPNAQEDIYRLILKMTEKGRV